MYSFIETELFTRLVVQYLGEVEYRELQHMLMDDPEAGAVRALAVCESSAGPLRDGANVADTA